MTAEILAQGRPPLYFNPETILATADCDLALFVQMMHENLLDFMEDVDDLSAALDCFSLGDLVSKPRFGKVIAP